MAESQDTDKTQDTILPNGVTIYGTQEVVAQIAKIVEKYPTIWIDSGRTVDIPEADWLEVPLKENWEQTKLPTKVYPLGPKDRALIDEEFDKLHAQGRMNWTTKPTPFDFPVFVVWRTIQQPGKEPI